MKNTHAVFSAESSGDTCVKVFTLRVLFLIWAAPSKFGTYRLCEQRRFRRACASAQSRQNLRCSLIQALNQEEPSDRKPDPWSLWMAGHAQLKFVMTECSKTQIRLTGLIYWADPKVQEISLTWTQDGVYRNSIVCYDVYTEKNNWWNLLSKLVTFTVHSNTVLLRKFHLFT